MQSKKREGREGIFSLPKASQKGKHMKKENDYDYKEYNERHYNLLRHWYHWILGLRQMKRHPALLLLFMPIISITVVIWWNMDTLCNLLDLHDIELLETAYQYSVRFVGVIIPLLLTWGLIELIGDLTARRVEARISMAFSSKELRYGAPILTFIDTYKGATIREFYSPIPMGSWIQNQHAIEDMLCEHFVTDIEYSRYDAHNRPVNKHKICICTCKGRKPGPREGDLYDDEF